MVLANMFHEGRQRPIAVLPRILDLGANLGERLALPSHFARREMPDRIARHPCGLEVCRLMAYRTSHRGKAKSVRAALDRRLVKPSHVPPGGDGRLPDGSSRTADWSAPCRVRRTMPP